MTQPKPPESGGSSRTIALTIFACVVVGVIIAVSVGVFHWPHFGSKGSAARSGTASPSFPASGPAPLATATPGLQSAGPASGAPEPTTEASPVAPPPVSSSGTYRSGTLTFVAKSRPTDLDAPAADLQWGRDAGVPSPGSGFDITSNNLGIQPGNPARVQWDLTPLKPTYKECATDTDTDSDLLAWSDFRESTFLCIHTDGGRAAIAKVTAADTSSVRWNITVYRKASD